MRNLLDEVEVEGQGMIGGIIMLSVAAVVVFTFAYPTIEGAIASITDQTHQTLAKLGLLALVLVITFGALRMAGIA